MSVAIVLLIGIAVLATCLTCRACSGPAPRQAATRRHGSALADRRQTDSRQGADRRQGADNRRGADDRRGAERHRGEQPGAVPTDDVETLLRAGGVCARDIRLVSTRARALGMKPDTMWLAAHRYGAQRLAIAIAGDLSHQALLGHLVEGSRPDFEPLALFAAVNGLEAAVQAPAQSGFAGLEIHEPGSWPYGPRAA